MYNKKIIVDREKQLSTYYQKLERTNNRLANEL